MIGGHEPSARSSVYRLAQLPEPQLLRRLLLKSLKTKLNLKRLTGKKAQSSLELGASLVVIFILLYGTLQVFLWVNKRLVQRQKDYEAQRVTAGNSPTEVQVDESDQSKYPRLNIFGR